VYNRKALNIFRVPSELEIKYGPEGREGLGIPLNIAEVVKFPASDCMEADGGASIYSPIKSDIAFEG
jgi:hypothetical protein